jgi:hypothetical protein
MVFLNTINIVLHYCKVLSVQVLNTLDVRGYYFKFEMYSKFYGNLQKNNG